VNTQPPKVVLLQNVINENVDAEGNLEPGEYNIAYDGVMTFMPEFLKYDGTNWEIPSSMFSDRTITVFCKSGDL
jgi:hypothetical protein